MKELQKFLEWDNTIKFLKTNLFKLFIIYLIIKISRIFYRQVLLLFKKIEKIGRRRKTEEVWELV